MKSTFRCKWKLRSFAQWAVAFSLFFGETWNVCNYSRLLIISLTLEIPLTIYFWWYSIVFFLLCKISQPLLNLYNSKRSLVVFPVDGSSFSYIIFPTPLYSSTLSYMPWVAKNWDYWRRALYFLVGASTYLMTPSSFETPEAYLFNAFYETRFEGKSSQ